MMRWQQWLQALAPPAPAQDGFDVPGLSDAAHGGGLGLGAMLSALDWDHVRAEVDRESRARIAILGAPGAGKATLLSALTALHTLDAGTGEAADEAPMPAREDDAEGGTPPRVADHGLFAIADVDEATFDAVAHDPAVEGADLIVWLLDGAVGLRRWEHEGICRLRAAGRPLLVALNKRDALAPGVSAEAIGRALACPVIAISARTGDEVLTGLLDRVASASANLETALGRELPAWRDVAARRATHRAAMLSGLVGLEPVPLLDIPFQVLIQLRLVLRLAAMCGEPLNDRYSRELIATLAGAVALRYGAQQVIKLVPLGGWLASGALAAGGTWAIGKLALSYFEHGRRIDLPRPRVDLPRLVAPRLPWRRRP